MNASHAVTPADDPRDTSAAWRRLAVAVVIGTIGSAGMWSFVVALPAVQAGFGVSRAEAALPYTLTMAGFALGGVLMGRISDRHGIVPPLLVGGVALAAGYLAGAAAPSLFLYALAQMLVGFGASASFAPIMADLSHWFVKRRGMAVAIASCGNYLAGTIWPPLLQMGVERAGWRMTHAISGALCLVTLIPLAFLLRARTPKEPRASGAQGAKFGAPDLSQRALLMLLVAAGVACCVAMAMPQVHLVAYCADLGYGPARGAEMLSIMLGFGIVSRLASGFVADRIGALRTLLAGSFLQGLALLLYVFFDGLASLYIISALFGLFQGGIVPMYALIVREYFPASKAGAVLGVIIMATLGGMALGGWLSGLVFDLTGNYQLAFLNGLAWNLVNIFICVVLIRHERGPRANEWKIA